MIVNIATYSYVLFDIFCPDYIILSLLISKRLVKICELYNILVLLLLQHYRKLCQAKFRLYTTIPKTLNTLYVYKRYV